MTAVAASGCVFAVLGMLLLIGVSILAENRRESVGAVLRQMGAGLRDFPARFRERAARHPLPLIAALESGFWLLLILPLIRMVIAPQDSTTARLIWYLTIAPHEIGHVVCLPFGRFVMVAGGSIWQIGFWAGLGLYSFWRRRQVTIPLLFWMITAHSFINLSVYIRDAQERRLPLLFGMGEDAHDWHYLLHRLDLLRYDDFLADVAVVLGVLLGIAVIGMGILTAWLLPRAGMGRRF